MNRDRDLPQLTLEDFRREVASDRPMPAGVAIAAVSAAFALGLTAKVVAISARRSTLPEHTARFEPLAAAAQAASQRLLQQAGDDVAAFEAYLAAKRLPQSTDPERQARHQAIDSAVRRVIDVPLSAAQEAAAGLQLCHEISAFTPAALTADLGVAAAFLAGALRSFLQCAESNVRQLAPDAATYRERLATEMKRHEQALQERPITLPDSNSRSMS